MTPIFFLAAVSVLAACTNDSSLPLNKDHWVCTETQNYVQRVFVPAGKFALPREQESTRCVTYKYAGPK